MGNENSNTTARNNQRNMIKPILKRTPGYPNSYPHTYGSEPIYDPRYNNNNNNNYPMGYNQNYYPTAYYSQMPPTNGALGNHTQYPYYREHAENGYYPSSHRQHHHSHGHHHHSHRHHHHHHQRRRSEHACQTSPSLLLGNYDIPKESRVTPVLLRESLSSSSSSSTLSESLKDPQDDLSSATVERHGSSTAEETKSTSDVNKHPSSSVVIKKTVYPSIDKRHLSPSSVTARSSTNTSKTIPPSNSTKTAINQKNVPRINESNRTTKNK